MKAKRNFHGCWTCRSRKVKCDTERPECRRCRNTGIPCEGYDIKLVFYQLLTIDHDHLVDLVGCHPDKFRRNIQCTSFPRSMLYGYDKLNEVLDTVDRGVLVGPFRVLGPEDLGLGPGSIGPEGPQSNTPSRKRPRSPSDHRPASHVIPAHLLPPAKLSIFAIKGPNYHLTDQNIYHILYPTFYPNIDSDEWQPRQDYMWGLILDPSLAKMSSRYHQLLAQFKSLAPSFVKFPVPVWSHVVVPYLDLLVDDFVTHWRDFPAHDLRHYAQPPPESSLMANINVVINLLIVAISAFNVANKNISTNDDIDLSLDLSINVRKHGLTLLNYHLDEYDNNLGARVEYHVMLMIAIVLQIEIDTYFNVFENYELLFSIGEMVGERFGGGAEVDAETLGGSPAPARYGRVPIVLHHLFRCMNVVFKITQRTTGYNYNMSEEEKRRYGWGGRSPQDLAPQDLDLQDLGTQTQTRDLEPRDLQTQDPHSQDLDLDPNPGPGPTISFREGAPSINYTTNSHAASTLTSTLGPTLAPTPTTGYAPPATPSTTTPPDIVSSTYLMYGLPQSLLDLFYEVVAVSNQKQLFKVQNQMPPNFNHVSANLLQRLRHWKLDWSLDLRLQFHRQILHYVGIVHAAIIICCQRLLAPAVDLALVQQTAESVRQYLRHYSHHRMLYWVIMVVTCEGGQGIDINDNNISYWRTKQLMMEVESRRNSEEPCSWMEVIREWDVVLYLG